MFFGRATGTAVAERASVETIEAVAAAETETAGAIAEAAAVIIGDREILVREDAGQRRQDAAAHRGAALQLKMVDAH